MGRPRHCSTGSVRCAGAGVRLPASPHGAAPCPNVRLQAIPLLKESIKKAYGKKGDKVRMGGLTGCQLIGWGCVEIG